MNILFYLLYRTPSLYPVFDLSTKKRTIDDSLICSNNEIGCLWQSDQSLQRNNEETILSFLDSKNVSDVMENIRVWSDLLSSHHHRSLLDREFSNLGITL